MIYNISWPYVTADSFKDIKKSRKKFKKKKLELWSDVYADVNRSPKKSKNFNKKKKYR